MKIAVTGLSNSGKTTIFNALTGQDIETTAYVSMGGEPRAGMVRVADERVDRLTEIFRPKKTTHAVVEYVDYAGVTKGDTAQNDKVFSLIRDCDAIVHVVRAFEDAFVPHPFESVDPIRDIGILELEMIMGDLEFVEKRLSRMEESAKKGKKPNEEEKKFLLRCRESLEREIPLRCMPFDDEDRKTMRHLQFISIKPEVVLLNIGEENLGKPETRELVERAESFYAGSNTGSGVRVISLSGKIEREITRLPSGDARAFLDDLGITEPALNRLIRIGYDLLGLISFLTVGEDEVRAWTIRKGTPAHQAAGKVHTDIERGFIRAETVRYEDFIACGSHSAARDRGLVRLEGKTYEVQDGDIINFRFNI